METDTVILSAKYDHYEIPVRPGMYRGFYVLRRGHYSLMQSLHIDACGVFVFKTCTGVDWIRMTLRHIPALNKSVRPAAHHFYPFRKSLLIEENGWKIKLKFIDEFPDPESDNPPFQWADFPGKVEIGFSFMEE